jgi:hypothetical protein
MSQTHVQKVWDTAQRIARERATRDGQRQQVRIIEEAGKRRPTITPAEEK